LSGPPTDRESRKALNLQRDSEHPRAGTGLVRPLPSAEGIPPHRLIVLSRAEPEVCESLGGLASKTDVQRRLYPRRDRIALRAEGLVARR